MEKTNFKNILIAILVFIIFVLFFFLDSAVSGNKASEKEKRRIEQNYKALRDSSITYLDELTIKRTENYVLLERINNISILSQDLQNKVDSLKKGKNGKIEILSVTDADISISGFSGSFTNTSNIKTQSGGIFEWKFKDFEDGYSRILSGSTEYLVTVNENLVDISPLKTQILEDDIKIKINTFTVINPDSSITIIASSPSNKITIDHIRSVIDPYVVTKLQEIYIDVPKKDIQLTWGIQAGLGVNTLNLLPVPYAGLGFQLNIGTIYEANLPRWLKFQRN